ncbi:hypothetical protein PVAP13_8NG261401, partial [Panicum virgatum]
ARRPPQREGAARRTKTRRTQQPETSGDGHGPGAAPAAARPPEATGGRDTETAATPRRLGRSGPADPGFGKAAAESDPDGQRRVDVMGKLGGHQEGGGGGGRGEALAGGGGGHQGRPGEGSSPAARIAP